MYEVIRYPDGGAYVKITNEFSQLVYKINSYEDLFLLKSIKDANPKFTTITIPCMFQQQHDRRFNSNESFELKLVCDFINSLGFEKVRVFHPHSDVTPALLNNCEVIDNTNFIKNVIWDINGDYPKDDYYLNLKAKSLDLMSTDAGGYKMVASLANKLQWQGQVISASKFRIWAEYKSEIVTVLPDHDFNGQDILIIDDLCVYGGTFINLAKRLRDRNIGKLYLAVSHITVPSPNPELFDLFDKVYTTNSKYEIDPGLTKIKSFQF